MKDDRILLGAAIKMNEDALVKIFDLYAHAIYKYVCRLCGDAVIADDIVGEVFAKLLEHLSAGTGPRTNLRSYLFQMAYHLVIDESRRSLRLRPIEAAHSIHYDRYSTYASVENRVLFATALRAIQSDLTEDQRHVVVLRFLKGFSLKETAVRLGKGVSAVKVIQTRAIGALRKALDYRVPEPSARAGD